MAAPTFTPATEPVWRMSFASLFPPRWRSSAFARGYDRFLLGLILLFQTFASLRLANTAFQDEALYLYYGHWQRAAAAAGGEVFTHPESFFSGAPQLYPVWGSYLDSVGGLQLARAFSLVAMLSATIAIFWMTQVLFKPTYGPAAPLTAAATFSLATPVIFLGNFATYDATSFALIAWAAALAVWRSYKQKHWVWSVAIGTILALAVAIKYASAIVVPIVLLLTLAGMKHSGARLKTISNGILSGIVFIGLLAASALTWAQGDVTGVITTTLDRQMRNIAPIASLLESIALWAGLVLLIMVVGGLILARTQPVLASVLLAGTLIAMTFQVASADSTSLNKHITLGLIFGAPLAGVLLSRISKKKIGPLFVAGILWFVFLSGIVQSRVMFEAWPNTAGLVQTIEPSLKANPTMRTVGDIPEPVQYALRGESEPWQWTGTYDGSFGYAGLRGLPAYERALADNYFQYAYFNGSSQISSQLMPQMSRFGFEQTATVETNGATWVIWQRFDPLVDQERLQEIASQ